MGLVWDRCQTNKFVKFNLITLSSISELLSSKNVIDNLSDGPGLHFAFCLLCYLPTPTVMHKRDTPVTPGCQLSLLIALTDTN